MQKKQYDLTNGSILNKLLMVAGPIMATQVFQMLYNLLDMFFVGRISSDAVAATGAAGMFIWLSVAFFIVGSTGAGIGVSQNKGKGDMKSAQKFAYNAMFLSIMLGILFAAPILLFTNFFIGLVGIREAHVAKDAAIYLQMVAISFPILFLNNAITGAFNGSGNAKIPFYSKLIGLAINIIASPLLIFTFGLGVMGAGIATTIGYSVTGLVLYIAIKSPKHSPFETFRFTEIFRPDKTTIRQILKWSLPIAIESASFTMLTMLIMNMIASYGANAIATKQIGVQIESLTWLVGGGFASAFTSFVGQNYGANKHERIKRGFKISVMVQATWGLIVTLIMVFGGRFIYSIFTDNPEIIASGIRYIRISAFVQITGCLDGVCTGAFRGMGKTLPPSITTTTFNTLRVFIAWALSLTPLGLYGVFIGAVVGIFLRNIGIIIWYLNFQYKQNKILGVA